MATPIHNDLILPTNRILVLPDEGENPTTGVLFRKSEINGGRFVGSVTPLLENAHILFVREMATEVEIDDVKYMAMHINAVVGLIPD